MANIRKLQENTAALVQNGCSPILVGAISGSGYVHPGKFETPSSPIRRHVPDAKYPDGMSVEKNSGCNTSGWNVGRATPFGFPKRTHGALPYPDSLREKHTALAIITPGQ